MYKEIVILTILHKGISRIYFYKGYNQFVRYPKRATVNVYRRCFTYFKSVFFKAKMKILYTMYNTDIHTIRFNVKNTDIRIKNKKIEFKLI